MYKSTIFWNNFHQYHLMMFLNFNTDMKPNTCIHVTGNNRNLFPIKKKYYLCSSPSCSIYRTNPMIPAARAGC